ncbi:MAG: hypothetical protein WC881_09915 [Elusimicrobiota bacterium]|jgi:hypothetical protein
MRDMLLLAVLAFGLPVQAARISAPISGQAHALAQVRSAGPSGAHEAGSLVRALPWSGPLALPAAGAPVPVPRPAAQYGAVPGAAFAPVLAPALPVAPAAAGPAAVPAEVAAFLEAARAGDTTQVEAFLRELPARFDGLAYDQREVVLAGLESAVRVQPKARALRRALQDLIVRDELEYIEPRLRGAALTWQRREEVLAQTRFRDIRWWDYFRGGVDNPEAEGVAKPDKSITLHVKSGWQKLPSLVAHFRALFSHEYTHRLQFEAEVTMKYGGEIPSLGTELLRGLELVGLEGLRRGMIDFITPNALGDFERGRAWMRKDISGRQDLDGFFWKGFLGGAAYELALQTGQWAAAWMFHERVSKGADPNAAERAVRAAFAAPPASA